MDRISDEESQLTQEEIEEMLPEELRIREDDPLIQGIPIEVVALPAMLRIHTQMEREATRLFGF